jgi:glutaredoxin
LTHERARSRRRYRPTDRSAPPHLARRTIRGNRSTGSSGTCARTLEWCPVSHRVRERLTELGVDYVIRQVPADKRKPRDLVAATGTDTVPVLLTDEDRVLDGEDRIVAFLGEHSLEPRAPGCIALAPRGLGAANCRRNANPHS